MLRRPLLPTMLAFLLLAGLIPAAHAQDAPTVSLATTASERTVAADAFLAHPAGLPAPARVSALARRDGPTQVPSAAAPDRSRTLFYVAAGVVVTAAVVSALVFGGGHDGGGDGPIDTGFPEPPGRP